MPCVYKGFRLLLLLLLNVNLRGPKHEGSIKQIAWQTHNICALKMINDKKKKIYFNYFSIASKTLRLFIVMKCYEMHSRIIIYIKFKDIAKVPILI